MPQLLAEVPTQAGMIYWPINKLMPVTTDNGISVMLSPLDVKEGYKLDSLEFASKIRVKPEVAQTMLFKYNPGYRQAYADVYESVNGISIPKMAYLLYFGSLDELKDLPCNVPDTRYLEELIQEQFYSEREYELSQIDHFIVDMIRKAALEFEGQGDIDIMLRPNSVINWLRGTRRTLFWDVYQALADYKQEWVSFKDWVPNSSFHESWAALGSEYRYLSTVIGSITKGRIELVPESEIGLPDEKARPVTLPGSVSEDVLQMLGFLGVEGLNAEGIGLARIHPMVIGRPKIVKGRLTTGLKVKLITGEYSSHRNVREAMQTTNLLRTAMIESQDFYTQTLYKRKGSNAEVNIFQVTINYLASLLPEDKYLILSRDYLREMSGVIPPFLQLGYNQDMHKLIAEGALDRILANNIEKTRFLPQMTFTEAIHKMRELIPILPDRFLQHYSDIFRLVAHMRAPQYKAPQMLLEKDELRLLEHRIQSSKTALKKAYGMNFDLYINI